MVLFASYWYVFLLYGILWCLLVFDVFFAFMVLFYTCCTLWYFKVLFGPLWRVMVFFGILSSPREARAFHELRRYHTRPLQLNWGPEKVHFRKT